MDHFLQALSLAVTPLGFEPVVLEMVEEGHHCGVRWVVRGLWVKLGDNSVRPEFRFAMSGGFFGFMFIEVSGLNESSFYALG